MMVKDEATAADPDAAADEPDQREQERPQVDLDWARRQRMLAVTGAILALAAFGGTIPGLIAYPTQFGSPTWKLYLAIGASALLALCCVLLVLGWQRGLRAWRSTAGADLAGWMRLCFVGHLLSYLTVLAAMYGALAESALIGWSTGTGTSLGVVFILVIAAQTIGGSQYLRHQGPPGTVPNYLRKLNAKVQSLR